MHALSRTQTYTHVNTDTHMNPPTLSHCHEALCEDIDITTLCTTSAQEKAGWLNFFIFPGEEKMKILQIHFYKVSY